MSKANNAGVAWAKYIESPTPQHRADVAECYLPQVEAIARKIHSRLPCGSGIDLGDLVSSGMIGCIAAVDRFDPARGSRFATFASHRIRGAMTDFLRNWDFLSRAHRHAVEAGMSHAVTNQSLDADRSSFSRTSLGDSNSPVTLHEAIEGGAPAPSARVEIEDFWRNSLKGADGQERLIMLLYYRDGMTMRAIGEQVGVSESRVSQIHSGVLQRMKNLLEQQRTHTRLTTAMESEITEMLKSSDPREHLIRRVQAVCNRRGCRRGRPLGRASVEKVISRLFDALVEA